MLRLHQKQSQFKGACFQTPIAGILHEITSYGSAKVLIHAGTNTTCTITVLIDADTNTTCTITVLIDADANICTITISIHAETVCIVYYNDFCSAC